MKKFAHVDSVFSEMDKIVNSDEHNAIFKGASKKEDKEDKKDKDDKKKDKEDKKKKAEQIVKALYSISETLDSIGFVKSSLFAMKTLDQFIVEAKEDMEDCGDMMDTDDALNPQPSPPDKADADDKPVIIEEETVHGGPKKTKDDVKDFVDQFKFEEVMPKPQDGFDVKKKDLNKADDSLFYDSDIKNSLFNYLEAYGLRNGDYHQRYEKENVESEVPEELLNKLKNDLLNDINKDDISVSNYLEIVKDLLESGDLKHIDLDKDKALNIAYSLFKEKDLNKADDCGCDHNQVDDELLYGDDIRKNQLKTAIEFYFSSRPGQYRDREKEKIKLLSKELKFNDNDLAEFALKVYTDEEFEEELSKDEAIDLISDLKSDYDSKSHDFIKELKDPAEKELFNEMFNDSFEDESNADDEDDFEIPEELLREIDEYETDHDSFLSEDELDRIREDVPDYEPCATCGFDHEYDLDNPENLRKSNKLHLKNKDHEDPSLKDVLDKETLMSLLEEIKEEIGHKDLNLSSDVKEACLKLAAEKAKGDYIFPHTHAKVEGTKDHFPIDTEGRARNALARANQFSSAPEWYKGSLKELVSTVARAVKKKYPSIDVTEKSKKPGKG